jgi:hypothetical protein
VVCGKLVEDGKSPHFSSSALREYRLLFKTRMDSLPQLQAATPRQERQGAQGPGAPVLSKRHNG